MSKVVKANWKEAETVDEVEAASDILVVRRTLRRPWLRASLKEDVLVASIGANAVVKHEVSDNLIRHMDLIVTDDLPAARADSGDLIAACQSRIARWDDILPLEKTVADGVPQPRPKESFQSNGIADEDLAVGRYVLEQAKKKTHRSGSRSIKAQRMTIFDGELGLQFVTHLANHYTVPDLVRLAQVAADKASSNLGSTTTSATVGSWLS